MRWYPLILCALPIAVVVAPLFERAWLLSCEQRDYRRLERMILARRIAEDLEVAELDRIWSLS